MARRRKTVSSWDRDWGTNNPDRDRDWCAVGYQMGQASSMKKLGCFRLKLNAQRKCQAVRRRGGRCYVAKKVPGIPLGES